MTISIPPVAIDSNPKYTPLLVGVQGFHVDVRVITNVSNDRVLLVISPDAVIPVISLNYIIFNTKRLVIIDTIKGIKSNEIGET